LAMQGRLMRVARGMYVTADVSEGENDPIANAHSYLYAINEDGSDYDDDVGGPAYVAARDGIDLEALSAEQDATARLAAQDLFKRIQRTGEVG